MISDGELWTADELFAALEGRPDSTKQMNQPGQQQQQGQQQQHGQQQGHGQQHGQQQGQGQGQGQQQQQGQQQGPQQGQQSDPDDMLDGYFSGGGLAGGSLGFASIDDTPTSDNSYFATLDSDGNSIDVQNDGYIPKNKKSDQFDNDYERMMADRGEVGQGGMKLGGGI